MRGNMTYQILIVDDEPLILAGIASLVDWEKHGLKIVGKAGNGQQALKQIEELKPDIVITDIKMPAMSGIDLIREAKKLGEGTDAGYILLTNLEEFSLAKEAMSLGVVDYLVKLELTEDVLLESINKAKSYCDAHKGLAKSRNEGKFRGKSPDEAVKGFFQRILLYEEEPFTQNPVYEEAAKRFQNPVLIMINFNYKFEGFSMAFTREDQKKVMTYAENILDDMVKGFFESSCLLRWEQNSFILIVEAGQRKDYQKHIKFMGEKIITVLKDYFEVDVTIAASQRGQGLLEFSELLYQAMSSMNYYYFNSSSPIVFYSEKWELNQRHSSNFSIGFLKKDIAQAIRQGDKEAFLGIIESLTGLLEENKPDKLQAVNACSRLYYFVTSFYEDDGLVEFPYAVNIIGDLNRCGCLNNLIRWLKGFGEQVAQLIGRNRGTRGDKILELVREYVMEHYNQKITLGQTAEEFKISPGYLSSAFKKQAGMNFSDYVAAVKIEKAKEMIETHQYMMYEVSDQLGFDNQYYFSTVFKKVEGCTPKEYETEVIRKRKDRGIL